MPSTGTIDNRWSVRARPPTDADLRRLAAPREEVCVSIYLPTHRAGPDIRQDHIMLRNLLDQAGEALARLHVSPTSLLAPARALVDDLEFWRHQQDGLALFLSPTHQEFHQLPVTVDAFVHVGKAFHLSALLTALPDRRFMILALSQNAVRLLDASRASVQRLNLDSVPTSLADALGHDWKDASLQFHTGTRSAGDGRRSAMFHGQNQGDEVDTIELMRFCQVLDSALIDWMVARAGLSGPDGAAEDLRALPMVLAGEQSTVSTYRRVTALNHVLEAFVHGNPEDHSDAQLRDRAWELVDDDLTQLRVRSVARLRDALGTSMASDDLEVIVKAACDGRVASLVLTPGAHRWGHWDAGRRVVVEHDSQQAGDLDLINLALRETLLHGGQVQAADGNDSLPAGCTAAATFRH